MLQNIKKRNNEKGFTIIEVLIVLAIAGLILLIVFLAVPALQRNARNTGRKEDAGRIAVAINDFISNNNAALPGGAAAATWVNDCGTVLSDAGTLNQFGDVACTSNAYANGAPLTFEEQNGPIANAMIGGGVVKKDAILLDTGALCPTTAALSTNPQQPATGNGNANQYALLYTIETSGGGWDWDCIQN